MNSAAAFLRAREAIVNLDYGEISQNRKTTIAWADESLLRPLRRNWWAQTKAHTAAPYVFDKEQRITIAKGIGELLRLKSATVPPTVLLGEKISITGECMSIPLPNETGRNIAVIGAPDGDCNNAVGMLQSAALSLAAQHRAGSARFLFCDFQGREEPVTVRYPDFASGMHALGFFIEDIPRAQFQQTLGALLDSADETGGKRSENLWTQAKYKCKIEGHTTIQGSKAICSNSLNLCATGGFLIETLIRI